MNTIKYKDLKTWYLDNEAAVANAERYFGDKQPNIFSTGFYSAPSWNWGYMIGICSVRTKGLTRYEDEEKFFEVVTQFGEVKAARLINIPFIEKEE